MNVDSSRRRRLFTRPGLTAAAAGLLIAVIGAAHVRADAAAPPTSAAPQPAAAPEPEPEPEPVPEPLVLYTTLAPGVLRPALDLFTERSGIPVRVVAESDLPGGKPGSLANRLKAERLAGKPGADLWWGVDLLEVQDLAAESLFQPYHSEAADRHAGPNPASWPSQLRGTDGTWYGLARRVRVLIYNTDLVSGRDLPLTLTQLASPTWKGRLALARPVHASASLAHLAAIRAAGGEQPLADWLAALADSSPILLDTEADVIAAVAAGRAHLGLTTSDLAISAAKSGQPIRMRLVTDREILPKGTVTDGVMRFDPGLAQFPTGLAIVRGGRSPDAAEVLVDFLLSNEVAQILEGGPFQAIRLGECSHEGLQRWCDGATGPGRLPRLIVGLETYSVRSLVEHSAAAAAAWSKAFPVSAETGGKLSDP